MHWYHPLVWWSSAQAARSRELVCDDKAVRSADEAVDYLKGLLLLTQSSAERIRLSAGAALQGTGSLLQERAARIARRTWSLPTPAGTGACRKLLLITALCGLIWLPVNVSASNRSVWSPWPRWSASILHELGITVRDYEIDSHRLLQHKHYSETSFTK